MVNEAIVFGMANLRMLQQYSATFTNPFNELVCRKWTGKLSKDGNYSQILLFSKATRNPSCGI